MHYYSAVQFSIQGNLVNRNEVTDQCNVSCVRKKHFRHWILLFQAFSFTWLSVTQHFAFCTTNIAYSPWTVFADAPTIKELRLFLIFLLRPASILSRCRKFYERTML
jgi:hypothetical protein